MEIKLLYGNFFFVNEISICGNNSIVDIDYESLSDGTKEILNSAKLSGVIEFEEPTVDNTLTIEKDSSNDEDSVVVDTITKKRKRG